MTSLFTAKKISVPGLLDDDALQEQLKQFGNQQRATQGAAPPPTAATDMADRVMRDYVSVPSARTAKEAPRSPVPQTPRMAPSGGPQRSFMEMARGTSLLGPLGPGLLMAEQFGTLNAEERQAEAESRAADARETETAFKNKAAIREQLRNMPTEEAERLGLPVPPAPFTPEELAKEAQQDQELLKSVGEKTKAAEAAVLDPEKQPTQTWWLNAAQTGARSAAEVGLSALKMPPIIWEQYEAAITGSSEKSMPREWLDKVDAEITKLLPGDKARAKDFVTQLAAGTGSMLAFMVSGYVSAAAGVPAGVSVGALGAASQGVQMYEEAEQFNATGLQKFMTLLLGAGLGVTEAIPIDRMFMRIDAANGGIVRQLLRQTTAGGLEEFIQEVGQAVGEDVVAKYLVGYDENRSFDIKEYAQRGLVGFLTGGFAAGALGVATEVAGQPDEAAVTDQQREQTVNTVVQELQTSFETLVGPAEAEAGPVQGPDAVVDLPPVEEPMIAGQRIPAAPAIETPEFKEWFGGSKVVDDTGRPLVVYHGTNAEFTVFDKSRKGQNYGTDTAGFFFESQYDDADMWSRMQEGDGRVVEAYLDIKNPLVLDAGKDSPAEFWFQNHIAYKAQALEGGHDGVIVRGENFVPDANAASDIQAMYVVFEPTQIKSVNNRGTFSKTDPDILASVAAPTAQDYIARANAPMQQFRGGKLPVNEDGMVELTHYAPQVYDVVDPERQGTGPYRGQERQRLSRSDPNYVPRAYYGVNAVDSMPPKERRRIPYDVQERGGYIREGGLGGARNTVYVDPNRIYNWYEDPLGLKAGIDRTLAPSEQVTQYERIIKDAGFDGAFFSQSPLGQTAIMFTPEVPAEAEMMVEAMVAPAKQKELMDQVPGLKGLMKVLTPEERARVKKQTAQKLVDIFEQMPDPKEMAAVAISGRAKRGWYARSAKALVDIFGIEDAPRFAALLAALSPQTSVESNAINALNVWSNWLRAGRPTERAAIIRIMANSVMGGKGEASVLPAWIDNSVRALSTPDATTVVLSGPKVNSFMRNLQGVTIEVTNDAWMANYANIDQAVFKGIHVMQDGDKIAAKGAGYMAMSAAVRRAADAASKLTGDTWTPAEIQETVWSWAKTLYEKADAAGEKRTAEQILKAGGMTAADIAATPDFATLFASGIYRNILERAGYEPVDGRSDGGDGRDGAGGDVLSAEGTGLAQSAFERHLARAARRLDALRARRAAAPEDAQPPVDDGIDFPGDRKSVRGTFDLADTFDEFDLMYVSPVEVARLPGLPSNSSGPVASVVKAAKAYARSAGIPFRRQAEYVKVDEARAARIAAAYDAMEHNPNDPKVKAAFQAMIDETLAQFQFVKASGLDIDFIEPGQPDPYPEGPKQVLDDLQRGHLWVFPTDQGFGTMTEAERTNPLLAPTDEVVKGRTLLANDVFRIVHDFFGHGLEGAGFGARGEENAWQGHMRLYTEAALPAVTSETRGQNSWVNFGPYGEQNRANQRETVYADQKTGLMPDWTWKEGVAADQVTPETPVTAADFEGELTPELFKRPGWAVVTAMKEALGAADTPENAARLQHMRDEFAGTDAIEISGMYKGVPQGASWLVFMDEDAALELGRRYDQESILTNKGLVYGDGSITPAVHSDTVVGEQAQAEDFYSVLPGGRAFSMGLDFDTTIPAERVEAMFSPVRSDPLPMFPDRTDQSFDRWFGKSKVKKRNGEPKVVFHGTTAPKGFRVFDPTRVGKTSFGILGAVDDKKVGFYFADKEKFARSFAEQDGGKGSVIPVFLRMENPLDVRKDDASTVAKLQDVAARMSEIDPSITNQEFIWGRAGHDRFWEILTEAEGGEVFVRAAKDLGYDGVRMLEPDHERGVTENAWVVFDNTQIKSAERNTGAYSPTNPDIEAMATASRRPAFTGEQQRPAQGVPEQPGRQAADGEEDLNLTRISKNFVRLLDLTARQGRLSIKGSNVMGQYSRRSSVVRLRTWGDLSTLVHEGGHAFHDSMTPTLKAFVDRYANDFMDVGTQLYGGDLSLKPKETHVREGFAEFFRVYALNRNFAETKYQRLTQEFTALLEKEAPQVKQGLDVVGAQFAAWLQLPSAQMLRNMVVPGLQESGINAAIKELRDVGFKTWYSEFANELLATSINRYASLNKLVNDMLNVGQANQGKAIDLKRADDPRTLVRLARNTGSRAMVQLTDGVYSYRGLQPTTRSLRDALLISQGVDPQTSPRSIDQNRLQDFDTYLVALRAIDEYRRLAEGKIERPPVAATLGDVQQTATELEKKYGTAFTEAAVIVHEYGMALWKKQFDAGLMTKETYQDGLERRFYAPLQRDMSDRGNKSLGPSVLTGGRSIVKRFRGSDRDIVSPMTALMHKTFAVERIIAQNDVLKAMALLSDRAGKAGAFVERIPSSVLTAKTFSVKEVARQLTRDDSLTEMDAQDLMTLLEASIEEGSTISLFRPEQASTMGENVLFYWENGKLAAIQIKDGDIGADVVNMFNGLGRENMHMALELVAMTSSAFRTAITAWPDFLLVNFVRDQMSAWIINDVGFKPFVTGLKGMGDELRQNQWSKMYNATMGIMGGMNVATLHDARVNRDLNALRGKGYIARAFNEGGIGGAITGMARVVELSETGTRLGIFRKAYERAKADGLSDWEAGIEASYTATDYIDFGLNGSKMLVARRTIPFLNAQLQGLYKMLRTLGADEVRQRKGLRFALKAFFKDTRNMDLSRVERQAVVTGRKAWIKMVSLGLLSAALHFLFEDDPDYQEAGEYLRTTGWVIPMGDGRIFYIPKPFELALVANAIERGLESATGDSEAKNRFLRGLALTMVPPTAPPAIQTMVEYAANKDFFSGREIVPSYMQALQPQLQFNNYTSDLAKRIGEITGWSPMVLDHFMNGLGASAYRDMVTMTNALNPNRPSMDETDAPILRRFVRDVRRGSASAQDFWAQASMINGKMRVAEVTYKNLLEAGNPIAANKMLADLPEDERAYALLNAHFKADAKRLNPFYRGRQITTVVSAMRREISSDIGLEDTQPYGEGLIKLTAREKAEVDEVLSEFARREIRNTLVATSTPGWANKKRVNVQSTLDLLETVEPRVRLELTRRLTKAKVYDADTVFEYWPEVKDRLLRDRDAAFLDDIVTIAKVLAQ